MPIMIQLCPDDGSGQPWQFGDTCNTEPFWYPIEQLNEVPGWPSGGASGSTESIDAILLQLAAVNDFDDMAVTQQIGWYLVIFIMAFAAGTVVRLLKKA